jgi:hypothetical protein
MNIYEFHVDVENPKDENENFTTYYHLLHEQSFTKDEFFQHIETSYRFLETNHPQRLLEATGIKKVYIESRHILDYMIEQFGYQKAIIHQRIMLDEIERDTKNKLEYEIEKESIDKENIETDTITYTNNWLND